MSQITTHVLDTARGCPAKGVPIELSFQKDGIWLSIAKGTTNSDGRIADLLASDVKLTAGLYRVHFNTKRYFDSNNEIGFYPFVEVVFQLDDHSSHYHIPLLLSAYGYSTYRGS
jgi:5-hydroxyisourate hydrolase